MNMNEYEKTVLLALRVIAVELAVIAGLLIGGLA